jgi:hypothetical protein
VPLISKTGMALGKNKQASAWRWIKTNKYLLFCRIFNTDKERKRNRLILDTTKKKKNY